MGRLKEKAKLLVIGDSCSDIFIYGDNDRLCPEAPVPVFTPITTVTNQGMAYNVFNNIVGLGSDTFECDIITNHNWKDIKKIRYVDKRTNQMFLRVDENDEEESFDNFSGISSNKIYEYDIIVISDYDKGFLNRRNIQEIIEEKKDDCMVFMDTKKQLDDTWWGGVNFIKINKDEYDKSQYFINEEKKSFEDILIVTIGEEGCIYNNNLIPNNEKVEVRDLCGAGDTFLAALVVEYYKTKNIHKAIDFAQHCAARAVSKKGVATIWNEF